MKLPSIKLEVRIENAEFRVKMEIERANKAINDKHDVTYLFKEQKAINADQAEELKMQKETNKILATENQKLRNQKKISS